MPLTRQTSVIVCPFILIEQRLVGDFDPFKHLYLFGRNRFIDDIREESGLRIVYTGEIRESALDLESRGILTYAEEFIVRFVFDTVFHSSCNNNFRLIESVSVPHARYTLLPVSLYRTK